MDIQDAILRGDGGFSPLKQFIAQHEVGKLILKNAREVADSSKDQIAFEDQVASLTYQIDRIASHVVLDQIPASTAKDLGACLSGISKLGAHTAAASKQATNAVTAADLKSKLFKGIAKAADERGASLMASGLDFVKLWLSQNSEALVAENAAAEDLDATGYEVFDSLKPLPSDILQPLIAREQVYRDLHQIASHIAVRLRPSPQDAPVIATLPAAIAEKKIFEDMPVGLVDSYEAMFNSTPHVLHEVLHKTPYLRDNFITPFQNFMRARDFAMMRILVEKLEATPLGAGGWDLSDMKKLLNSLPREFQHDVGALVNAMVDLESMRTALLESMRTAIVPGNTDALNSK
jgi:hypothetical protein